jgi:hypothetical protein
VARWQHCLNVKGRKDAGQVNLVMVLSVFFRGMFCECDHWALRWTFKLQLNLDFRRLIISKNESNSYFPS